MTFYYGLMKLIAVLWMIALLPVKSIYNKYGAIVLSILLLVMSGIAVLLYPILLFGLFLVIIVDLFDVLQSYTHKQFGLTGLLAIIILEGGLLLIPLWFIFQAFDDPEADGPGVIGLALIAIPITLSTIIVMISNLLNAFRIIKGSK